MDSHIRTNLFPYDFSLTPQQEAELFASVRSALEETTDEELFSAIIRFKVEEVADRKIRFWREQNEHADQSNRLAEIRHSAADYVSGFLNGQATPAAVEQLKTRLGIEDLAALDAELRKRIAAWIESMDDRELLQYDVVTVRDMVFAELRSWC